MPEELTELLTEAELPAEGFEDVLVSLESLREAPLPPMRPSPELAALLAGTVTPLPARRRAAVLVGALLLGVAGTSSAAALGALPRPVQEAVADLSDTFLPFQFPHPPGSEVTTPTLQVPETPTVLSPRAPAGGAAVPDDDTAEGADAVPDDVPSSGEPPATSPAVPTPAPSPEAVSSTPPGGPAQTPAPVQPGPPAGSQPSAPGAPTNPPAPAPQPPAPQPPAPAAPTSAPAPAPVDEQAPLLDLVTGEDSLVGGLLGTVTSPAP